MGKYVHGMKHTKLYRIWSGMKTRCYNANRDNYQYYGGRGIKICDEWLNDFQAFYDWAMANGYRDGMSIDRVDVNGHYEPSNCRWIPFEEQAANRSSNHKLTFNGVTDTVTGWSRRIGIPPKTIRKRVLELGWDVDRALSTPVRKQKNNI